MQTTKGEKITFMLTMLCVTDCPGGSYLIYAGLSTSYCVEFVSTEATCADMVASCQSAHNSEAKLLAIKTGQEWVDVSIAMEL